MTLQIFLTSEAETLLREHAAEAGVQPPSLPAESSNVRSVARRGRNQRPIHKRFLESGTTEDELIEELEQAKDEIRAERRARQA